MRRRYPLDALARLRTHQTVECAREKADLAAERGRAERRVASAVEKKELEKRRVGRVVEAESELLRAGRVRVTDLVQTERHRRGAERRLTEHEQERAAADRNRVSTARKEDEARSALARARGAERVIAEHRERFRINEMRAAERRDEEAVDDAFNPIRSRRKRGGG